MKGILNIQNRVSNLGKGFIQKNNGISELSDNKRIVNNDHPSRVIDDKTIEIKFGDNNYKI